MEEVSAIDLFTKILEKINDLSARMDKLERKVDSLNRMQPPGETRRATGVKTELPKVHDIKKEIEQMRAKHMSKMSKIPGK